MHCLLHLLDAKVVLSAATTDRHFETRQRLPCDLSPALFYFCNFCVSWSGKIGLDVTLTY
jgi:hypothetical protein